jgi:TPR repeat protein
MKQGIKTFLAGGVLAFALLDAAMAGPLEDGEAAYHKGDYATALQIFRPLAEQGDAAAQVQLGVMYENGLGVPLDYAQAVALYRKAADQGDPFGQIYVGDMYRDGHGVPQDYVRAHMWYNLATSRGFGAGSRDAIAAKMTPAQIAEAQRMAREWKPTK